jgi:hypothetical protein
MDKAAFKLVYDAAYHGGHGSFCYVDVPPNGHESATFDAALERLRKLGLLHFQKGKPRVDAGITGRGLGIYGPGNIDAFSDVVSVVAVYVSQNNAAFTKNVVAATGEPKWLVDGILDMLADRGDIQLSEGARPRVLSVRPSIRRHIKP